MRSYQRLKKSDVLVFDSVGTRTCWLQSQDFIQRPPDASQTNAKECLLQLYQVPKIKGLDKASAFDDLGTRTCCTATSMQGCTEKTPHTSGCSPFIKCECLLNVDKNIKTQYQDSAKQSIVLHQKRKRKRKTELVLRWDWRNGRTEGRAEESGARKQSNKEAGSQELGREERGEFRSYGVRGNWQQRLRQLRRYTVRKIEGLGTGGIDRGLLMHCNERDNWE